jgi:hypothetical protein
MNPDEYWMSEQDMIRYLARCHEHSLAQFEHGVQAVILSHPFMSEKRLRRMFQSYLDVKEGRVLAGTAAGLKAEWRCNYCDFCGTSIDVTMHLLKVHSEKQ